MDECTGDSWVEARRAGRTAGQYDDPKEHNPYVEGTELHFVWLRGWERGQEGAERMKKNYLRAMNAE